MRTTKPEEEIKRSNVAATVGKWTVCSVEVEKVGFEVASVTIEGLAFHTYIRSYISWIPENLRHRRGRTMPAGESAAAMKIYQVVPMVGWPKKYGWLKLWKVHPFFQYRTEIDFERDFLVNFEL
jgi:hypothetical protein